MTDRDPRTPQPGTNQPEPPDNSDARKAPGGLGGDDDRDPANDPEAQPEKHKPDTTH